jgi:hypothetical protein
MLICSSCSGSRSGFGVRRRIDERRDGIVVTDHRSRRAPGGFLARSSEQLFDPSRKRPRSRSDRSLAYRLESIRRRVVDLAQRRRHSAGIGVLLIQSVNNQKIIILFLFGVSIRRQ